MNQPGQQFFSRTAFALNQNRRFAGGHASGQIDDFCHTLTFENDFIRGNTPFIQIFFQKFVFLNELSSFRDPVHEND